MIEALAKLVKCENLTEGEAAAAFEVIMRGDATPAQIAGFMVALRMKGETAEELTGFARTARAVATPIEVEGALLDTCGTGGDGLATFNISTLAAIVAAAAGARVAKHGNRAASSLCGSADVLEQLGVKIDLAPEGVARCIEGAGIGFLFAPVFHPSFRFAAVTRRELGLQRASVESMRGGGPAENARLAREVLGGAKGPRRDVVLLNAAAALRASGLAHDWKDGLGLAAEAIDSGRGGEVLQRWATISQG